MCLIVIAHRASPDYPLAVAANRDEYHERPTRRAGFWPEHEHLLAGRDLRAGGTWLGVTRGGRFAAITNFRDPARTLPAPRSRGELTLDYLLDSSSPADYIADIEGRAGDYAGFNLLLGDAGEMWYFSNSGGGARALAPGIYGLSNALLDTPWPKVTRGVAAMRSALAAPLGHAALAAVVADRRLADPRELALQGLEGEMERPFSAQFIVNPVYGTRATTTLWFDREGGVSLREVSYGARGEAGASVEERFAIEPGVRARGRG